MSPISDLRISLVIFPDIMQSPGNVLTQNFLMCAGTKVWARARVSQHVYVCTAYIAMLVLKQKQLYSTQTCAFIEAQNPYKGLLFACLN